MKKATPALLLAGLAVAACLQAQAAEPQAAQPEAAATTDAAMMVGIDARTGKLRTLTPAETRALSAKAAAMPRARGSSYSRLPRTDTEARQTVRRHANGGVSVRVPLSAMPQVSVTRDAQGRIRTSEANVGDAATQQEVSE